MTAGVDGELTARRRQALDRHVDGCERCRRDRRASEALARALDALPGVSEVPAHLEQATLRALRLAAAADDAPPERPWGRWLGIGVPLAAATAATVLAVGLWGREAPLPTATRVARPAPAPEAPKPVQVARPAAPKPVAPAAEPKAAEPQTQTVARIVPPTEPPPELADRPDLFVDLPILRNMEKLEHYDSIQTTTGEAPSAEAQTNG